MEVCMVDMDVSIFDRGVVIKNVASLKVNPSEKSEVSDEVLHGMVIDILSQEDKDWFHIRTHYDYYGYMHRKHIIINNNSAKNWQKEEYILWQKIVYVMSEPNYRSSVIEMLTRGSIVKYTGTVEGNWEMIGLADERFGWIRKGFAKKMIKLSLKENEEQLRMNIVNTALDYMDTQYHWGGKTPLGIDCSGLSSMAYMMNGYLIPRDTGSQYKYLKPIERKDAKPGDLLFFPGHVAIYIGDGRYVHATGREGYTIINSFNPESEDYRRDLDQEMTGVATLFGKVEG
jgi:beta-lactamase class A